MTLALGKYIINTKHIWIFLNETNYIKETLKNAVIISIFINLINNYNK